MFYFYGVKVVKKRDIRKKNTQKILKKCSATDYLTLPNFCSTSMAFCMDYFHRLLLTLNKARTS